MAEPTASPQDVSRLFARVAFGATPSDLSRWAGRPYAEVVDHLLAVPAKLPAAGDDGQRAAMAGNPGTETAVAQRWWLERMRTTQFPLLERVTLLWHSHFATAAGLDGAPTIDLVLKQNQTIRQHALGNFRALAGAITVDPAMLVWLSGAENTSKKPNENYARELFELFTLGTRPQVHTERDVREAARALTGWTVDGDGAARFKSARHDAGSKRVLGNTFGDQGANEHQAVVDVALGHPVAARFVASKLVTGLAYVPAQTDLLAAPDPLVARVARVLSDTDWSISAALRELLLSDEFRTGAPRHVRPPVDLVVAGCKAFGVTAQDSRSTDALGPMGQLPFQPPNVGGWPAGPAWLSSTTMMARYAWGYRLFNAARDHLTLGMPAPADLDAWARRLGLTELSANTRAALQGYLAARPHGSVDELSFGVLSLLAASPDWMVV